MRWKHWLILAAILFATNPPEAFGQRLLPTPPTTRVLRNRDVLLMVKSGMNTELIKARIQTSTCGFDVFPPVLEDLKRRGVPESVLHLMTVVPNGPPVLSENLRAGTDSPAQTASVKLPKGTGILIETLYPVSSAKFKVGNSIAFSVVRNVYVDGALVIPRGTIARARIVRATKAKSWGRGGVITWEMQYIIAIDGTRIPVQLSDVSVGNSRGGQLAAGGAVNFRLGFRLTASPLM